LDGWFGLDTRSRVEGCGLPFREPVPLWPFKWLGLLGNGKALTDALFNVGFAHSSMQAIFGDAGILCEGHDAALLVASQL
jgi:hypothetical protein